MTTPYKHIFLDESGNPFPYTTPGSGGNSEFRLPQRNRQAHAERLRQQLDQAWQVAREKAAERTAVSLPVRTGTYLEFESAPDHLLMIGSLENTRSGIRLSNVQKHTLSADTTETEKAQEVIRATVYVPDGQRHYFLNRIQQYAEDESKAGKPKHQKLIEGIENIRLALAESFWIGPAELLPGDTPVWCEIWLKGENPEVEDSFRDLSQRLGIGLQETILRFPERTIILGLVNRTHLAELVESTSDLAELRPAKETARFFLELDNREQTAWVQNLRSRLSVPPDPQVAITVLDTGVNNGHLLLQPILNDADCHTFDPTWGVADSNQNRTDYTRLLRICGYGVPDLDRAINCYRNSLTLIAQEELQPFETVREPGGQRRRTRDMHLHQLPWPQDVLVSLGEVEVTLRITLSYFIEPSPGEVGWENRYRYASHALRFDLNRTSEDQSAFLRRLNAAVRDEESDSTSSRDTHSWTIGANGRKLGSIHSDIWTGTAADLATCHTIGVYPVIGWWRERHWLGRVDRRTRYSLIVSIDTPELDVDIYTPVATMLRIPISV